MSQTRQLTASQLTELVRKIVKEEKEKLLGKAKLQEGKKPSEWTEGDTEDMYEPDDLKNFLVNVKTREVRPKTDWNKLSTDEKKIWWKWTPTDESQPDAAKPNEAHAEIDELVAKGKAEEFVGWVKRQFAHRIPNVGTMSTDQVLDYLKDNTRTVPVKDGTLGLIKIWKDSKSIFDKMKSSKFLKDLETVEKGKEKGLVGTVKQRGTKEEDNSLDAVAAKLGLTKGGVRAIQNRALEKIKNVLPSETGEMRDIDWDAFEEDYVTASDKAINLFVKALAKVKGDKVAFYDLLRKTGAITKMDFDAVDEAEREGLDYIWELVRDGRFMEAQNILENDLDQDEDNIFKTVQAMVSKILNPKVKEEE